MAKNKKKAAAKKRNVKKNKQQAALTAKEAVAQKKAVRGLEAQEKKQKAAKDKATAKALKEKEKREQARAKKQAKIDKKKEQNKKAKQAEMAAKEEKRKAEAERRRVQREEELAREEKEREKKEAKQAKILAKKDKKAGKNKKTAPKESEKQIKEKPKAETRNESVSANVDYTEEKELPEQAIESAKEVLQTDEELKSDEEKPFDEIIPIAITQGMLDEELSLIAQKLEEELKRLNEKTDEPQASDSNEKEIEEILGYVKEFERQQKSEADEILDSDEEADLSDELEETRAPDFFKESVEPDEILTPQVGGIADLVSRAVYRDTVFVPAQKFESRKEPEETEAEETESEALEAEEKEAEEKDIFENPLAQLVFKALNREEEPEEKPGEVTQEIVAIVDDEEPPIPPIPPMPPNPPSPTAPPAPAVTKEEEEDLHLIDSEYEGEDDYEEPRQLIGVVAPLPADEKKDKKAKKAEKKSRKKEAKKSTKEKPVKKAKVKGPKNEAPSLKMGVALIINKYTSSARERAQKIPKGAKLALKAILALALIGALVFAGVYLFSYKVPKSAIPKYLGVTETLINVNEIEADLQEQLKKAKATPSKGDKSFSFFAHSNLSIEEWHSPLPVILGNVETNYCDFLVTVLNKENKVLYRSAGVKPGYYLPTIKLNNLAMNLGYGEHDLVLVVAAYNPQTYENVGVRYLKLNLEIGNEYGQAQEQETQVE